MIVCTISSFAQIRLINPGNYPSDLRDRIEYVGIKHNEYLSFIENALDNNVLVPANSNFLPQLGLESEKYFTSIGISAQFDVNRNDMTARHALTFDDVSRDLSVEGKRMITDLQTKINQNPSVSDFEIYCNGKINDALVLLTDDQEKFTVGIAFSVGKNSYFYWDGHSSNWLSHFSPSTNSAARALPGWASSDIIGAIGGAIHGIAGGPATMAAFGIMEGGFHSAGHLIGSGFGWW